jgi:hypothetical protein
MRMTRRSVLATGVLALSTLTFANRAAADSNVVHGVVTWNVVNAAAGTVTLNAQTLGQSFEVPLEIDAGGFSATYTTSLPSDDYGVIVAVGDCAAASTQQGSFSCDNRLAFSKSAVVAVGGGDTEIDLALPAAFGAVAASGTATLSGAPVPGTATFFYFYGDETTFVSGAARVPIDGSGHYAATSGSGFVFVSADVQQATCVITQSLSASASDVPAGTALTLDVSGDALPPAPPPGRIHLDFGVTGVPDAVGSFSSDQSNPQIDCAGGSNTPVLFNVPAGSYEMGDFSGAPAITPGTYEIGGAFERPNIPNARVSYNFPNRNVTVASGQTAELDFRFAAAFVRGAMVLDWSQFGPLSTDDPLNTSNFDLFALAAVPPGAFASDQSFWAVIDDATGVHNYSFELPINSALHWSFNGVLFALFLADGSFLNYTARPGVTAPGQATPVPPLGAGQSVSYDMTALVKVAVGHIEFAPHVQPGFGPFLNGTGFEVVTGLGVRQDFVHSVAPFGTPGVFATLIPGQHTIDADWFDASFNPLHDSLVLDVRPNETVSLTESAPHLDDVQPVPGTVCKQSLKVTGRATDPDRIASVTVNGTEADVKSDGSFSRTVSIPTGDSILVVRAADRAGNVIVRRRPLHRNADNSGCN